MNPWTAILAGLAGGAEGYVTGQEQRKKTAKENLADAISLGAPAAKVGALYQEAMRPGTIEGWFGAKPEGISPADYANAYDAKKNLAAFDDTFKVIAPHATPETIKGFLAAREYLRSKGMQTEEPAATPAPTTVAAPPPIAPVAAAAPPQVAPEPPPEQWLGTESPLQTQRALERATAVGEPYAPMGQVTVADPRYTPEAPQDLEEMMPEAKVVTSLPGDNPGMVAPGNIDLDSRKVVKSNDGSIGTEKVTTFKVDGRYLVLPSMVNGKTVGEKEAVEHFMETGEHLGAFSTKDAADAYAVRLHERQAKQYGQSPTPVAPVAVSPAPPAPPAPPEDPRKIAARKYLNPDNTLNLDAVEMDEGLTAEQYKAKQDASPASKALIGTVRALAIKSGPDAVRAFLALGDAPTTGELETIAKLLTPAITATTTGNALQVHKDEIAGRRAYLKDRLALDRKRLDASIENGNKNRTASMARLAAAIKGANDRDKTRLSVSYGALKAFDTRISAAERAARQAHQNWTIASYKAAENGKENDPAVAKLYKDLQTSQSTIRTLYGQRREAVKRMGLQDAGIDVAGFDLSDVGEAEVPDSDWSAVIDATNDYNSQGVLGD